VVRRGGRDLSLDWFDSSAGEADDLVGAGGIVIARCRAAADGRASTFYHVDERGRSFRCYAAPHVVAGRVVGAVLTVRETASEQEAARIVATERRLFTQAFSAASIGMAMVSLDGTFLRVNDRLARMIGRGADELIGMHLRDLVEARAPALGDEALRRLAASELDQLDHEGNYIRADGTVFPGVMRLGRVSDEDNRALFFVAHVVDATERKATEDELGRATERFSSAFENAPLGMALIDRRGEVFQVNRALTHMTGYSRAELLKMPIHELVHPDDLFEASAMYSAQLLDGQVATLHGDIR
jgi:diguanylate cyclase